MQRTPIENSEAEEHRERRGAVLVHPAERLRENAVMGVLVEPARCSHERVQDRSSNRAAMIVRLTNQFQNVLVPKIAST